MIFTREDILKIQNALLLLGRKDSEFEDANTPLNSEDYISILQDGVNKKVSINSLLSTLGLLKKDDFINVSDRYDEYYIQLSEAITIIAKNKRKKGLVITFQDLNGDWQIYQFTGEVLNFVKTELWKDLFDFKYPIVSSVLPDEEDLTLTYPNIEGNSFIQLKDKEYNPDDFSGMATKILRKNIVEIGGVKKNILTLDMISLPNTVYEIKYDFEIIDTIILGENSKFNFTTGSITYGGNKLNTSNVYSSLIGMIPNSSNAKIATNNSNILAYYLNLNLHVIIDNVYYLAPCNIELNHINLYGISELVSKLNLLITAGDIFTINTNIDNIIIKNLSIYGNKLIYYGGSFIRSTGQSLYSLHNIIVENIEVSLSRILTMTYPDIDMSINKTTLYVKNIYANNIGLLFMLTNFPIEKAVFDSLTIRNFHITCINLGTTNEYINKASLFCKLCIVRNCDVENDYVSTDHITYFSLIVFEGLECYYYNNRIKNLVNTNPESVVYDSYLAATKLYYYNNIVENIAGLDDLYRDIYKSKNTGKIKWYKNNTYTLSPKFFEDNNILENNWGNMLGNMQGDPTDIVIFEGNTIDIQFGTLSFGNFISARKGYFNNNIIKAAVGSTKYGTALISLYSTTEYIEINNNTINIDSNDPSNSVMPALLRDLYPLHKVLITNNKCKNVNVLYYYLSAPFNIDSNVIALNNIFDSTKDDIVYSENSYINTTGYIGFLKFKNVTVSGNGKFILVFRNVKLPQYQVIFSVMNPETGKVYNTLTTIIKGEVENTVKYTVYTDFSTLTKLPGTTLRVNVGSPLLVQIIIDSYRLNYQLSKDTIIVVNAYISTEIKDFSYYFPSTPMLPTNPTTSNVKGNDSLIYNSTLKKPLWWNGNTWLDAIGMDAALNNTGTTTNRPLNPPQGFEYYDTTIKKNITWNGAEWVNKDGSSLNNTGTTEGRPTTALIVGFIYKDTTLSKLIMWEGSKWINLDGTDL